uniref:RING-type domain-containing protein n=1 Tax=viral metagenome TaxID=1070528 RepID=A0A6C0KDV6_9ZZZZ
MSNENIARLIEMHLDNLRTFNDNYRQLNEIHRQYLENHYLHMTMFRRLSDRITELINNYGELIRDTNQTNNRDFIDSININQRERVPAQRQRQSGSESVVRLPNIHITPLVTTRTTLPNLSFIDSFLNILSPVPVIPTERNILDNCTIVRYCDISSSITECPIDLQPFQDDDNVMRINGCNHIFRETNLRRYFLQRSQCPLCRYDILSRSLGDSLD